MDKYYKKLIIKEIKILKEIQIYCQQHPKIDSFFKNITSKNPLQDIVLILYLFFAFGEKFLFYELILIMIMIIMIIIMKSINIFLPTQSSRDFVNEL